MPVPVAVPVAVVLAAPVAAALGVVLAAVPRPRGPRACPTSSGTARPVRSSSALIQGYTEIETLATRRASEMNDDNFNKLLDIRVQGMTKDLETKALQSVRGQAPAKAEEYKLDIAAEVLETLPADARDPERLAQDPLVQWWRGYAHKLGVGQEHFTQAMNDYFKTMTGIQRQWVSEEVERLGENGKARVEALGGWLDANLPKEAAQALKTASVNADVVGALELLTKTARDPSVTGGMGAHEHRAGHRTDAEAEAMKIRARDPLKRDPAYVRGIEQAWQRLGKAS